MRHKASGPFGDFLHRLPRAAAIRLEETAEHLPVRALAALTATMGLTIGGYAVVSSALSGSPGGSSEVAVDPAVPDAGQLPATTRTPGSDSSSHPEPSASPPGQPPAPPEPSRDLTRSGSPEPDEPSATPSTDPPTQPSPTQPRHDRSRPKQDDSPPDTSLSEAYPEPDAAVFLLVATEDASFICSLDGGLYSPCDSPMSYSDLHPGWHTFAVRAVDSAGNTDPSPAETRWLATGGPTENEDEEEG